MLVGTSDGPSTKDPGVSELVGASSADRRLDSDKLAVERLPEVHAVLGRLQFRVLDSDAVDIVGHGEDVSLIQDTELLSGRIRGVLANDIGSDRIVARDDLNVGGVGDLSQVQVQVVGPVRHLLVRIPRSRSCRQWASHTCT